MSKVLADKKDGEEMKMNFFGKMYTFDTLPQDLPSETEYNIADHLAGPLRDVEKFPGGYKDVLKVKNKAEMYGESHVQYEKWQREYGGEQGLSANIVVPMFLYARENGDVGKRSPPIRTQQVVISHPDDAGRIARMHIQKQPNFNTALFGSIISTIDNDHWKDQREHLVTAFLPKLSLEQVYPKTAVRSRECVERLRKLSENCSKPVDMADFVQYETKAQLSMTMFGQSEEFMDETNENFRKSMAGNGKVKFIRDYCRKVAEMGHTDHNTPPATPDQVAQGGKCPVHGPLANRIATLDKDGLTEVGNTLIFSHAGHDTSGFLQNAILFELSKPENKQYLVRLQKEIDDFFEEIGNREMEYQDLKKLPFLTRCLTETLRLWPSVPNGTFRTIQFDDYITGPNGEQVLIKKGTYVQIPNWSRHRNEKLWGDDVLKFNPDRDFQGSELWHDQVFAAYNVSTPRFSPFTFGPRQCIGMNFAHMEIRTITANLVRNFEFELAEPFKKIDPKTYLGINYGTMAFRDVTQPPLVKATPGFSVPLRVPAGMYFKVHPRTNNNVSKL